MSPGAPARMSAARDVFLTHMSASEDDERVLERLKWVRPSFLSTIADSGSHWLERPIVANRLAEPDDDAAPR